MKHISRYFCCAAAFVGLLAGFSSCDTSSRQHRGNGGIEPEVPTRPGENEGEGSKDITLKYGYGDFYGQRYNDKTDNFIIYLYEGNTDADGYFTGSAHMLTLDILLPKTGNLQIRDGVYDCSDEQGRTFIFIPAYDAQNDELAGSTLYIQADKNHYQTLAITDGKLEIKSYVTGQVGIEATIVAGGTEYKFHFKGKIDILDMTQGGQGDTSFPGEGEFPLKAKAQYNGEIYEGSDDYTLYLYYGDYDSNGDFKTKGTEIVFEFLTKSSDGKTIATGTYPSTSDNFVPGYVLEGLKQDDVVYPSYVYRQFDNKGDYSLELITSATVTISRSGSDYVVDATYSTPSGSYKVKYSGPLPFTDASGGDEPSGDVPKNVEMKNITRVVAEDWGQVWDGIECTDYRDWILYFYDKDASSTKEYTCVEILTEEKYNKTLPEMTFNKIAFTGNTADFVPGAIIAGYSDEDSNAWGTWYCKGGTAWYAATKGSLTIKRAGDGYSFDFDFIDEDETYGGTFKGSYTGKVEFTSADTGSGVAHKAAGKALGPQRGVSVRRAASAAGTARRAVGRGRPAAAPERALPKTRR